jgi:hypothetical protein
MRWLFSLFRRKPQQEPEASAIVAAARIKADVQQQVESFEKLHQGPKGGVYTVDDRGRKTYLKTFTGPRGGKYAIVVHIAKGQAEALKQHLLAQGFVLEHVEQL